MNRQAASVLDLEITDFIIESTMEHALSCFNNNEDKRKNKIINRTDEKEEVETLLKRCLDVGAVNSRNETALHVAAKCYNMKLVRALLDHIKKNTAVFKENHTDKDGLSLFHIMCSGRDSNHVASFVKRIPVDLNQVVSSESNFCPGCNPLHIAASFYNYETVKILIAHGASVRNKTLTGLTALHLVCKMDDPRWLDEEVTQSFTSPPCGIDDMRFVAHLKEIGETRVKIIRAILTNGCDVDVRDSNGANALMYAVRNDYELAMYKLLSDDNYAFDEILFWNDAILALSGTLVLVIETLLAYYGVQIPSNEPNVKRANPLNLTDDRGWTCLHYLSNCGVSDRNVIKYIIDHGADVNAVDHRFVSPLHMAISNRQKNVIYELLLDFDETRCERMLKLNVQDDSGNTLLHSAFEILLDENCPSVSRSFGLALDWGADIDIENENGVSILSLISNHNLRILRENESVKVAKRRARRQAKRRYDAEAENTIWVDLLVAIAIWQRLLMLKLCGYHDVKLCNDTFDKLSSELLTNSKVIEASNKYRILCEKEVQQMKRIRINRYASLDCLISKDINKVAVYAKSDELTTILDSPDFDGKFTFYAKFLKSRYVRALDRRHLLDSARDSLKCLTGQILPDLCLDHVLSYLSEKKLRDIIDVNPETRTAEKDCEHS